MHFVDRHCEDSFYSSEGFDFYFGDVRLGVFDIETTGLAPGKARFVLGGLLTPCVGGVRLRQFFSDGGHEETEILDLYMDALSETDVLFSYNGDRFDLPFLAGRLERRHRDAGFRESLSVDMYRVVRSHSNLRSLLPNLKQKTVEGHMGLRRGRQDRISGADSVRLYYEYLASKSPELLRLILLHNSDDLLQLARVLRIFDSLDIHEIAFHVGFPAKIGEVLAFIDGIGLRGEALECRGRYKSLPYDCVLFDEGFHASFDSGGNSFSIQVPCIAERGLLLADIEGLGLDPAAFSGDDAFQSGYLVLRQGAAVNYGPANRLAKEVTRAAMSRFSP
ncbi:MAG: ribonuclease H-like domain-containing protein [Clostridiales Family XIII bacterium]|jgi:uncharacterized protein YprB with RNaseH-like and TPR domain|nr:ribonuclease H-like domain-containing protein [Clostridiales Family XIII bacterium]